MTTKSKVDRKNLLGVLRKHCVLKGDFTLSSGNKSEVFFDIKQGMRYPGIINQMADILIENAPPKVPCFGGVGYGGSLLLAAMLASPKMERGNEGVFISTKKKNHGVEGKIRGLGAEEYLPIRMTLVEDVVTTGKSCEDALMSIMKAGGSVLNILTLVSRDDGQFERFVTAHGVGYTAIFTEEELLEEK